MTHYWHRNTTAMQVRTVNYRYRYFSSKLLNGHLFKKH